MGVQSTLAPEEDVLMLTVLQSLRNGKGL